MNNRNLTALGVSTSCKWMSF